jgi:hypothetical protein
MPSAAYMGYFKNGSFYSSGQIIQIPEQRRVLITILDEAPGAGFDKMTAWKDFKQMIVETDYENHLLTDDAFIRDTGSRELIDFKNESDI